MTENRSDYTKSYLLFQLGRLKPCTIFSVIFAALGFPLFHLITICDSHGILDELYSPFALLGVFCVLGTCAMSYITPVIAFQHLFSKTKADNILSLPLTANQRFIGDIAATYISFGLPFLIACIMNYMLDAVSESGEILTYYPLAGFFLMLSFSALNTAIITCCGRKTEAILYPFAINVVMPLIMTFGAFIAFFDAVGMDYIYGDTFRSPAVLIWPFGSLISLFANENSHAIIYGIVTAAVFIGLAFIGYKKRLAQNIGKSFVFRFGYVIITGLVSLALIFLYTYAFELEAIKGNIGSAIALGIILLILMLIMEIINYKKIKSIPKFLLRYGITFAGGLGICFLLLMSKGFGVPYYIPSAQSVECVEVISSINYNDSGYIHNSINAVNTETIELVRAEHKAVIEKAENTEEGYENQLHFTYKLKNGSTVTRNYNISGENASNTDFWKGIYTSSDYRTGMLRTAKGDENLNTDGAATIRFTNHHSSKIYLEKYLGKTDEVMSVLEKDLINDKDYGRHSDMPVGTLVLGYYYKDLYEARGDKYTHPYYLEKEYHSAYTFTIYESYENTIAFLSNYGELPTPEEALDDAVKNSEVYVLYRKDKSALTYPTNSLSIYPTEYVFVTAEEFRELAASTVNYIEPDGSSYSYGVMRGIHSNFYHDVSDYSFYKSALAEIGMTFDSYDFLRDSSIYDKDNCTDVLVNEALNDRCDEIFSGRKIFTSD